MNNMSWQKFEMSFVVLWFLKTLAGGDSWFSIFTERLLSCPIPIPNFQIQSSLVKIIPIQSQNWAVASTIILGPHTSLPPPPPPHPAQTPYQWQSSVRTNMTFHDHLWLHVYLSSPGLVSGSLYPEPNQFSLNSKAWPPSLVTSLFYDALKIRGRFVKLAEMC